MWWNSVSNNIVTMKSFYHLGSKDIACSFLTSSIIILAIFQAISSLVCEIKEWKNPIWVYSYAIYIGDQMISRVQFGINKPKKIFQRLKISQKPLGWVQIYDWLWLLDNNIHAIEFQLSAHNFHYVHHFLL